MYHVQVTFLFRKLKQKYYHYRFIFPLMRKNLNFLYFCTGLFSGTNDILSPSRYLLEVRFLTLSQVLCRLFRFCEIISSSALLKKKNIFGVRL